MKFNLQIGIKCKKNKRKTIIVQIVACVEAAVLYRSITTNREKKISFSFYQEYIINIGALVV